MRSTKIRVEPALLRRINERRLLEFLQISGPSSRAMLRKISGLTAPTVSKVVDSLLEQGLLEEIDPVRPAMGRPGRLVRMASASALVLGVLVDAERCTIVVAGLDGRIDDHRTRQLVTPETYPGLIDALDRECRAALAGLTGTPQGIGVVVDGLINDREQEVVCCANLHMLDRRNPARDLEARIGMRCRLLKGTSALCLSERACSDADGRDDFCVFDITTGLGLGVMSDGALIAGHSGMAGEIGHVVIDPDGSLCGCGNRGCLETLATDAAIVRLVSAKVGTAVAPDEVARRLDERPADFAREIDTVANRLALAASMAINILNPTRLLIHSRVFLVSDARFDAMRAALDRLGLAASVADCRVERTRSSKEQAAVAGIIHEITQTWAPALR
jgi:predicted NBD/HSP70 family sugar kinase